MKSFFWLFWHSKNKNCAPKIVGRIRFVLFAQFCAKAKQKQRKTKISQDNDFEFEHSLAKMKRKYPFGASGDLDDSQTQRMSKIHHSQKDQELRSESAMASVYAKTLKLLFGGAKQNGPNNNESKELSNCVSCVRTLNSKIERQLQNCSNCLKSTCSNCLSSCDRCNSSVCGNCSYEVENSVKYCLGCRDWLLKKPNIILVPWYLQIY